MPTPTRHYWGVPMDYNSHWYSCWPANSAAIEPRPSDRFEGYIDAAFARGLSWHLDIACSRRSGFPSWSWSGWIGPFAEDGWGDDVGLCRNSEVKIWLQRANGEHERLSEPVVANINNLGPTYTGYAPILRLEAWAIEINLTYLADGLSDVITPYFTRNPDPRYFVSIEAPEAPWFGGINGTWRWPVVLSMPVEEGDELHGELCRETFICVLLSKAEGFGLVVRKLAQGIMERIGYISIRWSHFDSEGPFDVVECFQIFSFDDVFDVFPKARRTILLR
ncbi:hypothetical protein CEP54_005451 [Fusarium duplospermum]|uniref:Uncharacterized protein n=1 Tax=Fusarium duplospermum TaxID=1325734 RepID=A0A428QC82_9HYPO|nr:hypothetical protein CEP54_005451 [Fusarium duplospermum]